jgi:hypothetical protein
LNDSTEAGVRASGIQMLGKPGELLRAPGDITSRFEVLVVGKKMPLI